MGAGEAAVRVLEGPHHLPCLPLRYQIAQKLHAVSQQRTPPKENDRERDLIDLLLLRTLVDDPRPSGPRAYG